MRKIAVLLAGFVLLGEASATAEEILIRKGGKTIKAIVPDVEDSEFIFAGTPTLVRSVPLGQRGASRSAPPAPLAVDPNAFYSNVTSSAGFTAENGGAALQGSNTITRLQADDLTATALPLHPGDPITGIRFTASNLNFVAVSARMRLRFYQDNGGLPGALITGFDFSPVSLSASTVSHFLFNPGGLVPFAAGTTIWAGMTFDDADGTTGATALQLNQLGQGGYGPPNVGTSVDRIFRTTAAGSFLASNPAGANFTFGGAPVANLGWELATPVELQAFTAE